MKSVDLKKLNYEELIVLHRHSGELIESQKASMKIKAIADATAAMRKYGFSLDDIKSTTNGSVKHVNGKKGARPRGAVSTKPCSICGFKTEPPHDSRSHRSQKRKIAFTAAEIAEHGWKRA